MKYAMIVALVLLGACAPDDADPADEGATEPTTEAATDAATARSPLDEETTGAVAPTTVDPPAVQGATRFEKVFTLQAGVLHPGTAVMSPQTEANKPQPVPWVPQPEKDIPDSNEERTEAKTIQGPVQGSAP